MTACAKGRMWKTALSILDEMKENGIDPNEVTYGVAVAACGNGGQWERALELLEEVSTNK
jgi:pentatricopeptide repeat protein